MNDFTKEELLKLKLSIMILYDKDGLLETKRIAYRIQSMLDNYCEHACHHEWDGILITTKPNTGKCKKCNEVCYIAIREIE